LSLLAREVSGQNCLAHVQTVTRYHRIQASPGYRAAARECLQIFANNGVEARMTTYPATGHHREWGHLTPQEWNCQDAELWLLDAEGRRTERLAWYQEMNLALIQRSASTPAEGVTAELAVVENAEEAAGWNGRDVAGKIALVGNGDIQRMLHFARTAGAVGLITARMTYHPPVRPEGDLPDALQYTSFWWSEGEPKGWGFVASTRQGDRLKQMAAQGPVRLWAKVTSEFYDGTIENVEGLIPGAGDQEVLLVAHLCHPRPSANDNASGPATVMEAARALSALIQSGQLPAPKRAIRFLLPPEMTGTFAHLANRTAEERSRIVAALNDDMVGQKQEVTGSTLRCEYPSMACPSFAGDLLALVVGEVAREEPALTGPGDFRFAGFRHAAVPYSGGSDHYILSDPSVGVPCPMLIQWPDRFYHTSADTIDKSDPDMMRRVGVMTAAYAYFLANAGLREAAWLATEMTALFPAQLHAAVQAGQDPQAVVAFRVDRKRADLQSLRRLVAEGEQPQLLTVLEGCERQVEAAGAMELQRLALAGSGGSGAGSGAGSGGGARVEAAGGTVAGWLGGADLVQLHPVRVQPGPITLRHDLDRLPDAESWRAFAAAHKGTDRMGDYLCYWADGSRSLAEICRLTELETGYRDDAWSLGYMQLLSRLKYVKGI
jgi:hypothetical protein